jgi:signal transduction histidine kinase
MFRLRRLPPTLAAVILTGPPLVALFALQWRSADRLEAVTTLVRRQASAESAKAVAQQIQRDFRGPAFSLLQRFDHGQLRQLDFNGLWQTIQEEEHQPFIDRVFFWSRQSRRPSATCGTDADQQVAFLPVSAAVDAAAHPVLGCDAVLAPVVVTRGKALAALRSLYSFDRARANGRTYELVYHFVYAGPEQRGGLDAFAALIIDSQNLRDHYFEELIPVVLGDYRATSIPGLAVSIIDDAGDEVYHSGRSLASQSDYDADAPFPYLFIDPELLPLESPRRSAIPYWSVRTGYEHASLDSIARNETKQQRVLLLLIGLVAAGGVFLTARATAREVHLARMKSEFLSSVSHDLKTPLAKIQLFADTLAAGRAKTPARALEYYQIIGGQARKLAYIIGGMLDFAKIEAGVREYPLEEIDLRGVVQSCVASFQEELAVEGFTVETSFPDVEVPVRGNSEALQQLLGNLITNAIKYSDQERFLRVSVMIVKSHATIIVADHGIGVPCGEERRIFKKFYRVSSVATQVCGSGLGLAIVEHVARAHNGRVFVASSPGAGSTFVVELPLLDGPRVP